MLRLNITIPEKLKKELENESSSKGLSLNAYIRMLLLGRKK